MAPKLGENLHPNPGRQLLPGCLPPLIVIVETFKRVHLTEDVMRFMALVFDVVKDILDDVFGEILSLEHLMHRLFFYIYQRQIENMKQSYNLLWLLFHRESKGSNLVWRLVLKLRRETLWLKKKVLGKFIYRLDK